MARTPAKQRFARKGFFSGLFAGAIFVVYKVVTHTGSIPRSDIGISLAVVLLFGLIGGLIGRALAGKPRGSAD